MSKPGKPHRIPDGFWQSLDPRNWPEWRFNCAGKAVVRPPLGMTYADWLSANALKTEELEARMDAEHPGWRRHAVEAINSGSPSIDARLDELSPELRAAIRTTDWGHLTSLGIDWGEEPSRTVSLERPIAFDELNAKIWALDWDPASGNTLDALGARRRVERIRGESDFGYRLRISRQLGIKAKPAPADTEPLAYWQERNHCS